MDGSGGEERRARVSELVQQLDVPTDGQKRDRSESGDSLPAGKRWTHDRTSPSVTSSMKEYVEVALDNLEQRLVSTLSKELHDFKDTFQIQLEAFEKRIKDLEEHMEDKDKEVEDLSRELATAKGEIRKLHERAEEAEINSRLPCLILSGSAMAPRRGAPGPAPAATLSGSAGGRPEQRPAGSVPAPVGGDGGSAAERRVAGGGEREEREDVCGLVVRTLNQSMPGLNMSEMDIDRAHRLPGANHRVIVRFVRSGDGSVRDRVFWRRLSLRGQQLYINESLTKLRGQLFRSLLTAKQQKKIHTVYTRGGQVFYKSQRYGKGERIDSIAKLEQQGFKLVDSR